MKEITIPKVFVADLLSKNTKDFPLYTTFLINQASQTAQSTRPKVVGQLSEEFPLFLIHSIENNVRPSLAAWKKYHKMRYPNAIDDAFVKTKEMIDKFRIAINQITNEHIYKWIEDLVYDKTFYGLNIEAVVREYLIGVGKNIRKATPEEESKNIDMFLDGKAIQIKPFSIDQKQSIKSKIDIPIMYYKLNDSNITIHFDESIINL